MNTFKLLIPSLYELYSIILLFLITFFFLFSGSLITKNKNLICNFCVGWSLFNLFYLISTIILKIDLDKTLCLYIVILIIFLIKYFNPKISPVELYVQVRKRVFNETVDIKTTFGKKTSGYNYLDYDVQIKNCLRDVKWGKFLILNLCKGHFVEMKNLLK